MSHGKRCTQCLEVYTSDHWAFKRENCPACGKKLEEVSTIESKPVPDVKRADQADDIKFDLSELSTAEQLKEAKRFIVIGLVMIVVAIAARLMFVVFSKQAGVIKIPLWFDIIVALVILIGSWAVVWSVRRIFRHKRSVRK
jgi:NAD-dependent SIR2 family protein deacetylase